MKGREISIGVWPSVSAEWITPWDPPMPTGKTLTILDSAAPPTLKVCLLSRTLGTRSYLEISSSKRCAHSEPRMVLVQPESRMARPGGSCASSAKASYLTFSSISSEATIMHSEAT